MTLFVGFAAAFTTHVAAEMSVARTLAANTASLNRQLLLSSQRPVFGVAAMSKEEALRLAKLHVYRPVKPVPPIVKTPKSLFVNRIATTEPVIFITIDDGVTPDYAGLEYMRQQGAVASLFLNDANIHRHYNYFKEWQRAGSTIQNHTVNHPHLPRLLLAAQKQEICDNTARLTHIFDTTPTLLRPPYGEFNDATKQAAAECGQKIIVNWTATVEKGQLHYQGKSNLMPGDIVLLHFTPDLKQDLQAVFASAEAQHLHIGQLEDWLY